MAAAQNASFLQQSLSSGDPGIDDAIQSERGRQSGRGGESCQEVGAVRQGFTINAWTITDGERHALAMPGISGPRRRSELFDPVGLVKRRVAP